MHSNADELYISLCSSFELFAICLFVPLRVCVVLRACRDFVPVNACPFCAVFGADAPIAPNNTIIHSECEQETTKMAEQQTQ